MYECLNDLIDTNSNFISFKDVMYIHNIILVLKITFVYLPVNTSGVNDEVSTTVLVSGIIYEKILHVEIFQVCINLKMQFLTLFKFVS